MDEQDQLVRAYARFPRRLLGLTVDGFLGMLLLVGGSIAASASGLQSVTVGFLLALLGLVVLYEPVLVSRTGGTVGHHVVNLRVERETSGERLSFGTALLRSLLKGLLGIPSFFFILLTRRHQSLHDKLTHSVVVVQDLEKARPEHYVYERAETPGARAEGVSVPRRVLVILAYAVGVLIIFSFASALLVSAPCLERDACSSGENLTETLTGLFMILGWGAVMVLGWTGRLPGARAPRTQPEPEEQHVPT